jgi:hypothetical protein
MVPDAWVYRAADRLITRHGADALQEVNRLICDALDHRERGRAVLMLRIRLAILTSATARAAELELRLAPLDRYNHLAARILFAAAEPVVGDGHVWRQLQPARPEVTRNRAPLPCVKPRLAPSAPQGWHGFI